MRIGFRKLYEAKTFSNFLLLDGWRNLLITGSWIENIYKAIQQPS